MNDWLTGIVFGDVPTLMWWHQFVPGSWHLNEHPCWTTRIHVIRTSPRKRIKKSISQEVFLQHQNNDQKGMPKIEERKRQCSLPTEVWSGNAHDEWRNNNWTQLTIRTQWHSPSRERLAHSLVCERLAVVYRTSWLTSVLPVSRRTGWHGIAHPSILPFYGFQPINSICPPSLSWHLWCLCLVIYMLSVNQETKTSKIKLFLSTSLISHK